MYALLSRLTDRPLKLFTNKETITQQEAIEALELKAEFEWQIAFCEMNGILDDCMGFGGYWLNLEELKGFCKYFEFLVEEWNAGRVF